MRRRSNGRRTRRPRKGGRRKVMRMGRKGTRTTMVNRRAATVIADRFITKLKYADRLSTPNSAAAGTGAYIFNLNSIFDPDRTASGHQPSGRDQLAQLYNRYRVFGVSWRVSFFPVPSPTPQCAFAVVPVNDNFSLAATGISALREYPRSIVKLSSSDQPTVFVGRQSLASLTGQTSTQYKAGDRYQAPVGADPAEIMTLQVCANTSGASTSYGFEVQLTYHVEFFDPVAAQQS